MSPWELDAPVDALYSGSGSANVYSRGAMLHSLVITPGSTVGRVQILTSSGGTVKYHTRVQVRTQGPTVMPVYFSPPMPVRPRLRIVRVGGTGGANNRMTVLVRYYKVRDRAASV